MTSEGEPPPAGPHLSGTPTERSSDPRQREIPEDYLSAESLSEPRSEDRLLQWLVGRGDYLPLFDWDRRLVRRVAELESPQPYLRELPQHVLSEEAQADWAQLTSRYRDIAARMVAFWRRERQR